GGGCVCVCVCVCVLGVPPHARGWSQRRAAPSQAADWTTDTQMASHHAPGERCDVTSGSTQASHSESALVSVEKRCSLLSLSLSLSLFLSLSLPLSLSLSH